MKIARKIVALGAAASMSLGMFAAPAVAQDGGIDADINITLDILDIIGGSDASTLLDVGVTALDDFAYTIVAPEAVADETIVEIVEYTYWTNEDGDVQAAEPEDQTGWDEVSVWLAVYADDQAVDVTSYVETLTLPEGAVSLEVVTEAGFEIPGDDTSPAGTWVSINALNAAGVQVGVNLGTFFVENDENGNGTPGGATNVTASAALLDITASSGNSTPQCAAAVATVGIPLLLLPPLALSSQLGFAGLSEITAGIEAQLQDVNTQIQQGTGIFDPETARMIEQVNNALAPYGTDAGQVVGVTGLLVVGGLAANHILTNCL